jgi:SEC-C motif
MPIKKRDPIITGRVVYPWSPSDPCPCGSGESFANCCLRPDGGIYKTVTLPIPPAPVTGYARAGCYMKWTADCCHRMSGEHFVSETVLTLVGDQGNSQWRALAPAGSAKTSPYQPRARGQCPMCQA